MNRRNRKRGFLLVISGAIFWGMSGTAAQKLFQHHEIPVTWLVTTRLLVAGIILLTIQFLLKDRSQLTGVWKSKHSAAQLIIFSLFGMITVQYTYMVSIKYGNAAVATLLQYLAPVMIILYLFIRKKSIFTRIDLWTVSLALIGCFLLLTNGSTAQLSVPLTAVIWGILSGVALAFYTLYPASLLKQFDSLVIVGWAMVIGGMVLSFFHAPWQINLTSLPVEAYFYLLFVIVFGTAIAHWFYVESLQTLSPKETSLLSSLEPLAAVITTVFWLKEPFGLFQWMGTACLLGMIVLMAGSKPSSSKNQQNKKPLRAS